MQVITSDISTVAADQLTPVLNQNQKAEELIIRNQWYIGGFSAIPCIT